MADGLYQRYRDCAGVLRCMLSKDIPELVQALMMNIVTWFLTLGTSREVWEGYCVGTTQRFVCMVVAVQSSAYDWQLRARLQALLEGIVTEERVADFVVRGIRENFD